MTRQHIADPETVNKLPSQTLRRHSGLASDATRAASIGSSKSPTSPAFTIPQRAMNGSGSRNPRVGIGQEARGRRRRWPGGHECAEIAAQRGHEVILLERRQALGGQLKLAASVKGRGGHRRGDPLPRVPACEAACRCEAWASRERRVRARLGRRSRRGGNGLGPQPDDHRQPLARSSAVAGIESERVLTTWDLLESEAQVGHCVLVVDDGEGSWKGISVALQLAGEGHEVHLSTPLGYVGAAVGPFSQNKCFPGCSRPGSGCTRSRCLPRSVTTR